mmetsp:Transcript_25979/g.25568  ORF Transcript_25979/g.25568 Transcript_25979/m.25568 type:complete len:110 (+) Transcript_25979:80-409(+)
MLCKLKCQYSISSDTELNDALLDQHSILMKFKEELKAQINILNAFYSEKKLQITDELEKIFSYFHNLVRINSTIDLEEAKKLLSLDERDDAQNRATSMKRAFSDIHKQM